MGHTYRGLLWKVSTTVFMIEDAYINIMVGDAMDK